MEPVGNGGLSGVAAVAMAIVVALITLAMVGVGGGFAHPLMSRQAPLAMSQPSQSQG